MERGKEEKPHIGIYGRCNVGKSTIINFITGQNVALVSSQPGTTTDPVRKSFEIIDFAPVVFIDTAGIDDKTILGAQRTEKSMSTLAQIDLALLVFSNNKWEKTEQDFAQKLRDDAIPLIIIHNNIDGKNQLDSTLKLGLENYFGTDVLDIDALNGTKTLHDALINSIKKYLPESSYIIPSMFSGDVETGDNVLLVCPIDPEAPSGRLILPQVRAIRDLLDLHAVATVVQPEQVKKTLESGSKPKMVVIDSQMFAQIKPIIPEGIKLTSFSILLARMKGDYSSYLEGLNAIDTLKDGDRVLILENCAHQSSCEDIGRVKIPRWLNDYCGCKLNISIISGLGELPEDLNSYALAIQCGGCMVTRSQLLNRIRAVKAAGVPITNYGMAIEKLHNKS